MKTKKRFIQGGGWIIVILIIWFASAMATIGQTQTASDEFSMRNLINEVRLLRADLERLDFENRKLQALLERIRNLESRTQNERKRQAEVENQLIELRKFREIRRNELSQLEQPKDLNQGDQDKAILEVQIDAEKKATLALDEAERVLVDRSAAMFSEITASDAKLKELNGLLDEFIQSANRLQIRVQN
jgi:predicted RNase H-like nuclease (RuvC/YqgF family)